MLNLTGMSLVRIELYDGEKDGKVGFRSKLDSDAHTNTGLTATVSRVNWDSCCVDALGKPFMEEGGGCSTEILCSVY